MATGEAVSNRVLTVPNLISAARLLLVPVLGWLLLAGDDLAALIVLALASASDWLDGVLARRLHQVTRLGQLLDPVADRLFILVTIVALAWRGLLPWWLVGALLLRDLVLGVMQLVLARAGWAPLQVHLAGKAGTFALLYAFPLVLLAGLLPGAWSTAVGAIGWAAAWWGVVLYWTAGVLYLYQARQVLAEVPS
jgi:cardiolipin synthase